MTDTEGGALTYVSQRTDAVTICPGCPERPYVHLRLSETVERVKRVTFTTHSHDQGFSGEQERSRGTYNDCYSYFELALVNDRDREKAPRKLLQYNRHALLEPYTHENVWSSNDKDLGRREWVRSIRGGDTIQIIPLARFPAWRNFILSAEISAVCEEVDNFSPISPLSRALSGLSDFGHGVYRQLDVENQEIRLIHILPGEIDEVLRCRISYTSLQDADTMQYECISYCWGGLQDSESIQIMRQDSFSDIVPSSPIEWTHQLPITKNLYTALRYLRYKDRERVLWTDAVCINQRNFSERGKQVAMMRQIYAKSTKVIIWVGESDPNTTALLRAALKVGEHYQNNSHVSDHVASMYNDHSVRNYLHRIHAAVKEVYEDWGGLDFPLLQREWFHRTWVIQEVCSAHSSVLQCGDVVVPWSLILRINACMHRPSTWTTPWRRAVIPDIHMQLFDSKKYTTDPMAREFRNPTKAARPDILDILLYGMDLEATDPRDKVFALLGFLDKASNEELEDEIKPDYNKSVSQVFANFTRWWIRTHISLRILSAIHANAGRTWQHMNTPSTSIEHPTRPTWSLWHDGRSSWSNATLAAWNSIKYDASLHRSPQLSPSPPHILSVEGCVLGAITSISYFPYFSGDPEINELRPVYDLLLEPTNARNVWTSSAFQTGEWDESGKHLVIPYGGLNDHGLAHYDFLQQTGGAIQCHHPCYITTSEGNKGLCPPMAEEGDIVVILFGGNIPYILRETKPQGVDVDVAEGDTRYHFVGECYLQGYMQGLAIHQLENPEHFRAPNTYHLV